MATIAPDADSARRADGDDATLAGLDALETTPHARRTSRDVWSAVWPKIAALGIALGAWQAVVWSEWKPTTCCPDRPRCSPNCGDSSPTEPSPKRPP